MRNALFPKLVTLAIGAAGVAMVPSAASATSYQIQSAWLDTASFGGAWEWGQIFAPGLNPAGEAAGIGRIALTGYNLADPQTQVTLKTYCIDIYDWLGGGVFSTQSLNAMAPTTYSATKIETMVRFLTHVDPDVNSLVDTVDKSAAAQLAIWEILNETGPDYDVTAGAFHASGGNIGGAIVQANSWLGEMNGWRPNTSQGVMMLNPNGTDVTLGGNKNQPQVYSASRQFNRMAVAPVPEPASWLTMIAGFGAIGVATRRRRAGARATA